MWSNAANGILPASPWLKSNSISSDSNPATARTKSRAQQALVTIWKTVGGVLGKESNNKESTNRESETSLDLENMPIPEAVLREYETIDSPSTSSDKERKKAQLPIISPRYSPRNNSPSNRLQQENNRAIYTPPGRERSDSRPRTPSPARPNYTEASCRAGNQNYIESVVREARGLCEAHLDTEEADEYVELHASVLNAQETATTLRLARTCLQQNWGAVFYECQLEEVIGWRSKPYFVIDKVTPCSIDGGPSPAMIGGIQVGDVVVGVNDKQMKSNVQFVNEIKKELTITLEVVRPNQVEEITDEMFEDQQDEIMKEVLEQARRNAIDTLARMKGMNTTQKRVFLDACV